MTTPVKSASLLLRRHLSPAKLTPNYKSATPIRLETKRLLSYSKELEKLSAVSPNAAAIRIKIDYVCEEDSYILNSPNRNKLLENGLQKYDLFYYIGKGTFGTVIKANYKGQAVAAKIIKLESPKAQISEKNILGLIHKNIIQTIDVIVSEKYGIVVMEYCKDSKNLQEILDNTNIHLDNFKIVTYTKSISDGLEYCHRNNILHLDIKPKNILLCYNDICKICDFGNSFNEKCHKSRFKYQGTVAYTAPEILKGKAPTIKCDIYSLGMLIWQLSSLKNPYEFVDNEVIIYKVVKFNFRPEFDCQNVDLVSLCKMCWHENPIMRPNASQVSSTLEKML